MKITRIQDEIIIEGDTEAEHEKLIAEEMRAMRFALEGRIFVPVTEERARELTQWRAKYLTCDHVKQIDGTCEWCDK